MLPSYIIQDGSIINGCSYDSSYDCRPKYWYSTSQTPKFFSCVCCCIIKYNIGNCGGINLTGFSPPYIACYERFKKEYRLSYSGSERDLVSFDIYGNIRSYGGNTLVCNIESCGYCFAGSIVKYFMRCGNYLMTTSGCVYCTMTLCRQGQIQTYLNSIGDPKRCNGCLYVCFNDNVNTTYYYCIQYKGDDYLKLFQFKTCAYYHAPTITCYYNTSLIFSITNTNIIENIICCKTGCFYYWRDIYLYFSKSQTTGCGTESTGDIVEYDEQNKSWYGLIGSPCTTNSSSNTTTYLMIGDVPKQDNGCIYNNCITTIKKVIAIPKCITCNCTTTDKSLKYNCIQKINGIYNINGSWTVEACWWNGCCISGILTPISLNTCNSTITTIYHNYCYCTTCNQCNELSGFGVPIFIAYTPRNTFSVIEYIPCNSLLKFYEYTCCWLPISGCCFGMNTGYCGAYLKPKYIYDEIEDSFIISFHKSYYCCASCMVSEPDLIKIPTCTGIINQMIRAQNFGPIYCSNCSVEMSCCIPIICNFNINSSNIICGIDGCCCGYITDICLRSAKPNINVIINVSDCIYCMLMCTTPCTSREYYYYCYYGTQFLLSTSQIDCNDYDSITYGARNRTIRYLPI